MALDMDSLFAWVQHYGYAGLFTLLILGIVGLPVPDETLLVFSGYLVSTGRLQGWATYSTAFLGSISGISISYLIGRSIEHSLIHRYGRFLHLTERRMDQVRGWFHRIGDWALFIGYFIPGVRHFTALVAGMSKLEYPNFAVFAYTGAAVWVGTFITAGYYLGANWQNALHFVHRYTLLILVTIVVAAFAVIVIGNIKKK